MRPSLHLRAHFEAARCLYNALLGEATKRLRLMRADPRWQEARIIPKKEQKERHALFSQLRYEYGFSEYALHHYATSARTAWIADHLDANTAQKLATRAYQAANRVCIGQAKKVRFRSKGRGLDSVEGKNNKLSFCEDLKTDARKKRRLERKLDRQRRANNPQNYDAKGRVKSYATSTAE